MATNVYNSNHMQIVQWVNGTGSAISSGDIVVMGTLGDATLGVALVDLAISASGSVGFNCGVTVAKVSAAVFAAGESLTWDASASKFDDNAATPASGDVSDTCRADVSGANAEASCSVWLTGIPGALTA